METAVYSCRGTCGWLLMLGKGASYERLQEIERKKVRLITFKYNSIKHLRGRSKIVPQSYHGSGTGAPHQKLSVYGYKIQTSHLPFLLILLLPLGPFSCTVHRSSCYRRRLWLCPLFLPRLSSMVPICALECRPVRPCAPLVPQDCRYGARRGCRKRGPLEQICAGKAD